MPVFLTLTDSDITDPSFWAVLDIGPNSTINVAGVSDTIQITMTGNLIAFTDTISGTTTTYTDADLAAGSFSQFVEFIGNDADNDVSGSVGLNASGYVGGRGDDTLKDDGTLGGTLTGRAGDDVLIGGTGNNNISGGRGDDILRGGSGSNNILQGGRGNDTLFGEDGGGNLIGGRGDDVIYAGLNTGFVRGGSGTDSLVLPFGSTFTPFSPGATGGNVSLPGGGSFVYLDIDDITIACFTDGTPIRTPNGDVPVETIAVGDLVETLDRGAQPVRWVGQRRVCGRGKHAPVCFLPQSIGNSHRIRLSPQHRVLVSGWACELWFHEEEILCPAKHLCDGDKVFSDPCDEVTYVHLMFDQHEIVFSGGALLESFFPGDYTDQTCHACRDELFALFPGLENGPRETRLAARPVVKKHEASVLKPPVRA